MTGKIGRAIAATSIAAIASLVLQAAVAEAVRVELRVEGAATTLFEGPVDTKPHDVNGGDGSGPHPCSGGLGSETAPSVIGALDDGLASAGISWRGLWDPSFHDFFVDRIGPDSSTPPDGYWGSFVDEVSTGGGCSTPVGEGERILWAYGAVFKNALLRLDAPAEATLGEPFTVTVTDRGTPIAGATVGDALTDGAGKATLSGEQPGELRLKAERADAVRSNLAIVCVRDPATTDADGCEPASPPPPPVEEDLPEPGSGKAGELRRDALRFLRKARHRNGGFAADRRGRPNVAMTSWATMAVAIQRPGGATRSRRYLRRAGGSQRASELALRAAALRFSGDRSRRTKRALRRLAKRQRQDGSIARDTNATALAALAWHGRKLPRPQRRAGKRAGRWLVGRQHESGGFSYGSGVPPDVDTTGMATWAIARTHPDKTGAIERAATYLIGAQRRDGGFPSTVGGSSNSQSTGMALAGLRAAGVDVRTLRSSAGIGPIDFLAWVQRPSGAIAYSPSTATTPVWTTSQALLGVPPPRKASRLGPVLRLREVSPSQQFDVQVSSASAH